jgi:hypothetical protein
MLTFSNHKTVEQKLEKKMKRLGSDLSYVVGRVYSFYLMLMARGFAMLKGKNNHLMLLSSSAS